MARPAAKVEAKNQGVKQLLTYLDGKGALSRSELSRACEMDPSRLRRIMLGTEPTLREARALAEQAGVRVTAWLDAFAARGKETRRKAASAAPVAQQSAA